MAKSGVRIRVVRNDLPKLTAALRPAAGRIVRKAAFDIQAGAQQRARVDTSAMENGFYVVTNGTSSYADATAEVRAADADAEVLPEVTRPQPLQALVAAAAGHTAANEYGTPTMPAQPMLTPAAEAARPGFEAALAQLLERA